VNSIRQVDCDALDSFLPQVNSFFTTSRIASTQ
jgi:hypothetical protein